MAQISISIHTQFKKCPRRLQPKKKRFVKTAYVRLSRCSFAATGAKNAESPMGIFHAPLMATSMNVKMCDASCCWPSVPWAKALGAHERVPVALINSHEGLRWRFHRRINCTQQYFLSAFSYNFSQVIESFISEARTSIYR